MTDIGELHKLMGTGPHLVEIDWRPNTKNPVSYTTDGGNRKKKWQWQHVFMKKIVTRFRAQNKKTWDTGKLYEYMSKLLQNDVFPEANTRYLYVRQLNGLKGTKKEVVGEKKITILWVRWVLCSMKKRE